MQEGEKPIKVIDYDFIEQLKQLVYKYCGYSPDPVFNRIDKTVPQPSTISKDHISYVRIGSENRVGLKTGRYLSKRLRLGSGEIRQRVDPHGHRPATIKAALDLAILDPQLARD